MFCCVRRERINPFRSADFHAACSLLVPEGFGTHECVPYENILTNSNLPISQIKPVGRYYLDLAEILRKRMGNATNSATVVRIQEIG